MFEEDDLCCCNTYDTRGTQPDPHQMYIYPEPLANGDIGWCIHCNTYMAFLPEHYVIV